MAISKEEFEQGVGTPVTGFVSLPQKVGEDQTLELVNIQINRKINDMRKFSVKDSKGEPLGWNYRFHLKDGRVWDVSKKALYGPLLEWCLPEGADGPFQPTPVVLYRKPEKKSERESIYGVRKA